MATTNLRKKVQRWRSALMPQRLLIGMVLLSGVTLGGCGQSRTADAIATGGALGGFERAERGCTSRAEAQGLFVEGVQFTQSRPARGGRITGAETVLIVTRTGRTYSLRCQFDYRTGSARLSSA